MPNLGKLRHGQDINRQFNVPLPFTRRMYPNETADALVGSANLKINPVDMSQSEVETPDLVAYFAALDAYHKTFASTIENPDFPKTLNGISVVWDTTNGSGDSSETGTSSAGGTSGTISLSLPNTNQGSASVLPEIIPDIDDNDFRDLDAVDHYFFVPTSLSKSQMLVRLTKLDVTPATVTITIASPGVISWNTHGLLNGETVIFTTTGALPTGFSVDTIYYVVNKAANTFQLSLTSGGTAINTIGTQSGVHSAYAAIGGWPIFKRKSHTLVLIGQKVSLSVQASARVSYSWSAGESGFGYSKATGAGEGESRDFGSSVRAVVLPPTIHGAVALSGDTTNSEEVEVEAEATITGYAGASGSRTANETAAGSVTPTTLSATSGKTSIPTHGKAIYRLNVDMFEYGYSIVRAKVFDFATLA